MSNFIRMKLLLCCVSNKSVSKSFGSNRSPKSVSYRPRIGSTFESVVPAARVAPRFGWVVQSAIEDFAQELALVIRRFLKLKAWRDTERLAIGGGFRASRIGELVIGRAGVILKSAEVAIDLSPIRNDSDAAGLIGAAHLVPSSVLKATTRSSPLISAAPISAPASSSSI
jgi:hypothetical protein